jgi:hypothetical protein
MCQNGDESKLKPYTTTYFSLCSNIDHIIIAVPNFDLYPNRDPETPESNTSETTAKVCWASRQLRHQAQTSGLRGVVASDFYIWDVEQRLWKDHKPTRLTTPCPTSLEFRAARDIKHDQQQKYSKQIQTLLHHVCILIIKKKDPYNPSQSTPNPHPPTSSDFSLH